MANDGSNDEADAERQILADAGKAIRKRRISTFLPRQSYTRPEEETSHLVSARDLHRLRSCQRGTLHPYLELAWGAVLGNSGATFLGISKVLNSKPLENADFIAFSLMGAFLLTAIAFTLVSKREGDTIALICDEIEGRPKA